MKRKLALLFSLFFCLLITGCIARPQPSGGGFDLLKFLQNPFVMIVGAIIIVVWMWKHSK